MLISIFKSNYLIADDKFPTILTWFQYPFGNLIQRILITYLIFELKFPMQIYMINILIEVGMRLFDYSHIVFSRKCFDNVSLGLNVLIVLLGNEHYGSILRLYIKMICWKFRSRRTPMPKYDFNKVRNRISAWVFTCKFAAYFQNTFS